MAETSCTGHGERLQVRYPPATSAERVPLYCADCKRFYGRADRRDIEALNAKGRIVANVKGNV